ncbi:MULTISPECIES: hypothetical protein [Cyanophyceae]|uniref:hypothetical protein n=1 Tax=Cyanophyceae TaxID=3028117 RepID=UPI001685E387|nr:MULTISPECIES: hypothetical protein [Cyanophyceae]MBD1915623.1 hypothetical protein [Phormidium sp. FACHB-77]MBD2031933.1 hypothetical protein [Phormidium sp. FACHB-322]MBD2050683.1 hypothetical protein [Leptolyngbya sp. FACHB-60]
MTLPPALRYRLVRLQSLGRSLNRPTVWGGLGLLGLLAVAVPQYSRHPEWRSQYNPTVDSAAVNPDTNLGNLSSDDLADLAEIDNLAVLLDQIQPTTATALEEAARSPNTDPLALPTATEEQQPPTSPFANYLERSRFRFSTSASGSEADSPNATQSLGPSSADPAMRSGEGAQPSALQQALNQRSSASTAPPSEVTSAERTPVTEATPTDNLTPSPWMVEGSLPGVDQRFIRTTPQMSPPPGTTGYTLPPALAPSPSVVAPVAPATLNLDFGTPTAAPSAGVTAQPPTGIPSNTPSSPPQPEPAPFSAPRPPGVYTGNGYINTFSDPSGPVD